MNLPDIWAGAQRRRTIESREYSFREKLTSLSLERLSNRENIYKINEFKEDRKSFHHNNNLCSNAFDAKEEEEEERTPAQVHLLTLIQRV